MEDAQRTATNVNRTPAGLNSNLVQEPTCRQLDSFPPALRGAVARRAYRRRCRPETLPLTSVSCPRMNSIARAHSALMFAALMIGHHFSISAL